MAWLNPVTGKLEASEKSIMSDREYALNLVRFMGFNRDLSINELAAKIEKTSDFVIDALRKGLKNG